MENYENKELLKDAAKKSLESLKDLKPGTEEYNTAANMALKLYDRVLVDLRGGRCNAAVESNRRGST